MKAPDAPLGTRTSPAQCSSHPPPRVQTFGVDNEIEKQTELVAVCEERGIKLR